MNALAATGFDHKASPDRWSRFRRLLEYYLECVREDGRGDVVLPFGMSPPEFLGVRAMNGRIERVLRPAESAFVRKLHLRGQTADLFYGYPVLVLDRPNARGTGTRRHLFPVFFQSATHELVADRLTVRCTGELRANAAALDELFGSRASAQAALTQLGLGTSDGDGAADLAECARRLGKLELAVAMTEPLDPTRCRDGDPTPSEAGLLNCAVVFIAEPSRYTAGLERELQRLQKVPGADLDRTALAYLFAGEQSHAVDERAAEVVEVSGLNARQRECCLEAARAPLTVVTGPPGTGKSQVVVNLLASAYLRGAPTVFSSRNHKAVEVVEERLNALSPERIIMRLGGGQQFASALSSFLEDILAAGVNTDAGQLSALRDQLALLRRRSADIERSLEQVKAAHQLHNALDQKAQVWRLALPAASFDAARRVESVPDVGHALDAVPLLETWEGSNPGFFGRMRRRFALRRAMKLLSEASEYTALFGPAPASRLDSEHLSEWLGYAVRVREQLEAARDLHAQRLALAALLSLPRPSDLVRAAADVHGALWKAGGSYLAFHRRSAGSRLGPASRTDAAQLKAVTERLAQLQPGTPGSADLRKAQRELIAKVADALPLWSVTNLSAPSALPFQAAMLDCAVIDEASQCDIPSALPLLFRARRAVVIGDPKQLPHVAALDPRREMRIAEKHGLTAASDQAFTFVNNSLYDLAAGRAGTQVVGLEEHFRSHENIIGFSNELWYGQRLQILTDPGAFRLPEDEEAGIRWTQVTGAVQRPEGGSAFSLAEAKSVVEEVVRLARHPAFRGKVGVVTPFRAQANLIMTRLVQRLSHAEIQRLQVISNTAHGFQGDERDVVLFSPCVGEGLRFGARRFLAEGENVFNVAVTRARAQLHVFGDLGACARSGVPHIEEFAKYFERVRCRATRDTAIGEYEPLLGDALRAAGLAPIAQYPVGPYRLDFAVLNGSRQIDVEVDGESFHRELDGTRLRADFVRDNFLAKRGWKVRRFWAVEVRDRLGECVRDVLANVQA